MVWRPLGLMMIVPTLSLAAYLVWMQRRKMEDFWPNVAILCWISANSVWMLDEFYALGIRRFCLVFFGLGFVAIGWWLVRYFPTLWQSREA